MNTPRDYWSESLSNAAEECGLVLTPEQLAYLAEAIEGDHENYGMAFYSPPAGDSERAEAARVAGLHASEVKSLRQQLDVTLKALRNALQIPSDRIMTVDSYGHVRSI